MSRVWSLVSLLGLVTLMCVGIMYIADILTQYQPDRQFMAIDRVRAWCSSLLVIRRTHIPLMEVVNHIGTQRALSGVPILVASQASVESYRGKGTMTTARELGIQCVLLIHDDPDPYRAIQRVWVTDVTLIDSLRYNAEVQGSIDMFRASSESVDGGNVFTY